LTCFHCSSPILCPNCPIKHLATSATYLSTRFHPSFALQRQVDHLLRRLVPFIAFILERLNLF
jgi:hypothetical protein